jgi:Fe-S cluster assembly protein SufB
MTVQAQDLDFDYSRYGFRDEEKYLFKAEKGLTEKVVRELSGMKGEPEWMLRRRLQALEIFFKKPTPISGLWGNPELAELDYNDIHYFVRAGEKPQNDWDAVPAEIKNTFEKLGIPEAERKFLAGVGAQYESEVVYHSLREEWSKQGVIFLDTDTALKEYPELFKQYFGTVIPSADNKYAALNTAVWSGGSFVYVPKGVHVDIPLQAYFRINAENMGQFERTLIVVEDGASAHYIEGCTAPIYRTNSLHSAVVEIRWQVPLHHDSELGQQHLQSGDEASHGLRRGQHGVG